MHGEIITAIFGLTGIGAFTAAALVLRPVLRRGLRRGLRRCLAGASLLMLSSTLGLAFTTVGYWYYRNIQFYPDPSTWQFLDRVQTGSAISFCIGFLVALGAFFSLGMSIPRNARRQGELEILLATLTEQGRERGEELPRKAGFPAPREFPPASSR